MKTIQPSILYYGTPVILLTTLNEDGSTNISPISSSWALGNQVIMGIGLGGKALENMERHLECVINVPSPNLWEHVEKLASLTGKHPVPDYKRSMGFSYQRDKFAASGLTAVRSEAILPDRIQECPIQIEANVTHIRLSETFAIVETESVLVHAHEEILAGENHIDPTKWSPLIYNFRHYFGLGEHLGKTFRA